jgi:hypothetical protein
MTLEQGDDQRAIDEASSIIEETRHHEVGLSLETAYWVGMTLVTTFHKDSELRWTPLSIQ